MNILAPSEISLTKKCIWLIGGTQESGQIARMLAAAGFPCTISVATAAAERLYPASPHLKIAVGQLDSREMEQFCRQQGIAAIVDASHPHAAAVSVGAMAAARGRGLPYLRYERPEMGSCPEKGTVIELASFEQLLSGDYLQGQRVLLAVGSRPLPHFQAWQERAVLFARLLPTVNSLAVAAGAGFSSDRLIAIRPPLTPALEKALWQQWGISLAVTKASGEAGGEGIKRAVSAELGVPLIVIARPKLTYPQQTGDFCQVIAFCRQYLDLAQTI